MIYETPPFSMIDSFFILHTKRYVHVDVDNHVINKKFQSIIRQHFERLSNVSTESS